MNLTKNKICVKCACGFPSSLVRPLITDNEEDFLNGKEVCPMCFDGLRHLAKVEPEFTYDEYSDAEYIADRQRQGE